MRRHKVIMAAVVWMLAIQSGPVSGAQSDPKEAEVTQTDEIPEASSAEQERDRIAAIGAPGKHHQHLMSGTGDWSLTIKVWRSPGAEPAVSHGTAEGRSILGGRFLETVFRGEIFGQAFEGQRVEGYDNQSEQYVSTWRDTMGTYTMIYRGQCEDDGRVRIQTAEFIEPVSGRKIKSKAVTTIVDADSYTYESYVITSNGTEIKNLELLAKRDSR